MRFRKGKAGSHKENEKKRRTGNAEWRKRKMTGCEFLASRRHKNVYEFKSRMC